MTQLPAQSHRSVSRMASFGHAFRGMRCLLNTQANARIHLVAALMAIALGCYFGLSATEWALTGLTIGLVLCAEALNTAIEFVVDLASPEWHALARDAKDVAAAAVLISAIAAMVVGALVFVPKIFGG